MYKNNNNNINNNNNNNNNNNYYYYYYFYSNNNNNNSFDLCTVNKTDVSYTADVAVCYIILKLRQPI